MTDFVTVFVDGQELEAADMNLIRSNRTGAMKPIDDTTSNWQDNDEDFGSSTYQYKTAYFKKLGSTLDADSKAITNINIDSGNIDGTPIGAASPSTGAFTTLTTGDVAFKVKKINIGDWNMVATASVAIAHGITFTSIISMQAMILTDGNGTMYDLSRSGTIEANSTNITLNRTGSGFFDNTSFDATVFNRGYIYIVYT